MKTQEDKFNEIMSVVRGTLKNNGFSGVIWSKDALETLDELSRNPKSKAGNWYSKASERTIKSFSKWVNTNFAYTTINC